MTHFFERRDPWGHGLALWVLMGLLFVVPPAVWSVTRIDLEHDVENWLPASDSQTSVLNWYRGEFAADDQVLISWEGSSLDDPRVARLAEKLNGVAGEDGRRRNGLPHVASAAAPNEIIERMVAQGIDRNAAIESLCGLVIGNGPLRITLTEAGRAGKHNAMNALVADARERLQLDVTVVDVAAMETFDVPSESGEGTVATGSGTAAGSDAGGPVDLEVRWPAMQFHPAEVERVRTLIQNMRGRATTTAPLGEPLVAECRYVPGSPVAVTATLSEAGEADPAGALEAIRNAAREVGVSPESLRIAGHAVVGVALNQALRKAAWDADYPVIKLQKRSVILLSVLASIVAAAVVLRSVRMAGLVLVVAAMALLISVAIVPATSGSMNLVVIVLPTLLWVVTVSGAIHVANYWRHAAHMDPRDAVVRAVKQARRPCLWAGLTTAIGIFSLMSSPLAPVKDFGWYGAIGCIVSVGMVLYALPALLQFFPPPLPAAMEADGSEWNWLGERLWKRRALVLTGCLLACAAGTYGLRWFHTESRLIRYFPENSQVAGDFKFFEEHVTGIMPIEVVVRFDETALSRMNFLERLEVIREIEGNMRNHEEISGVLSLADFQPAVEPAEGNSSFVRKARYNRQANTIESRVKEMSDSAVKSLFVVAKRDAELPIDSSIRACKAGDELWRITAHAAVLNDFDYGQLVSDLDGIAQAGLKKHAGAGHVVTGTVPLFVRTQKAVLQGLIKSLVITLVVVTLVMSVLLKSPLAGLMAMIPNALPTGMVFGLLSWSGAAVDIGTMVTASVALGLAVDGTLHLLTWFRQGLEGGLSRRDAETRALMQCGPAMWQTSIVVSLGVIMLGPADLLLISRFGLLMGALVGTTLLANVVLLPVLLAGPLGRLVESTLAAPQAAPSPAPAAEGDPRAAKSASPALQPHLKVVTPAQPGRKLRVD